MELCVRPVRRDDFPVLESMCRGKHYFDSEFMPAPQLREFTLGHFQTLFESAFTSDQGHLIVAEQDDKPVGYAILMLHTVESITQEPQTLFFDWFAPTFGIWEALIGEARRLTRQAEDHYLVVHLQEPAKKEQLWAYRLGFRAELNRVVRHIAPGHRGPRSNRYVARPARESEHLFIIRVNAEYSAVYRPAGRDVDLQTVQAGFLGCYVAMDMHDKDRRYIILEDTEKHVQAGYIILIEHQLPIDKPAFYTYDVAVAPEYMGRGLSLYLCGAAEDLLGDMGGGLIFGDTSLDNIGAVNGDRQLGFIVDSKRWGLDCRL